MSTDPSSSPISLYHQTIQKASTFKCCESPMFAGTSGSRKAMSFGRKYRFALALIFVLIAGSVFVVPRLNARQPRHGEARGPFFFLPPRGYTNQATRLYEHLLR